ncbi:hypothetical protein CCR75_000891 [Bremia lactucae]|uniref:WD repeat-containing protein 74 n=1 Tax=Bremia lactucae TaxID=4779 RepID=A0A976FNH7_BRELC|nr:hypothetical protein CCR75_000891 [Bremia lactucae]
MRVLVGDETGLLKSIVLETKEQRILSNREHPQARSRGIQRLCWSSDGRDASNCQPNVVLARANGLVESYEASHGNTLRASRMPTWSWPSLDNNHRHSRCIGLEMPSKHDSVVQCFSSGDVFVRHLKTNNVTSFHVGSDLHSMRLDSFTNTVIGVGGKECDLKLWSLETEQVLFRAKNVTHDKLDMRVPVWIKDLRFLATPGTSNGHRVLVGTGYRHVRIYDSNTKRRPVQELHLPGENPIQSLCISSNEMQVFIGDTAGNLDVLDVRTLTSMGRCTGPVGSIRDLACHPTLPFVAAVGLDRMVHVFDTLTRKLRYLIYAKQRLNAVLFTTEGIHATKHEDDDDEEPWRKKLRVESDDITFQDDELKEEAYEGLELSSEDDQLEESSPDDGME